MPRPKFVLLPILLVMLVDAAAAEQQRMSVTVTIDTSKPGPRINREIYGQFIEHEGTQIYDGIWVGEDSAIPNVRGYRKDVVDALKRLHVPVIRWPGGCFADQYDWRDGIGPRAKRPVTVNAEYGGTVESNVFGTHEFLDFAELIGADPYISVNVGSMTPLQAAGWLEYMTSAKKSSLTEERRRNGRLKPWNIKYIGIGNELWGCGGNMRPEFAADMTRRFSGFLNAAADQTLIKVASGPSANVVGDDGYRGFAEVMMNNALDAFGSPVFQALSLHYYAYPIAPAATVSKADDPKAPPLTPATGFAEDKWVNILRSALGMESAITDVSGIMDKHDPDKKIALFVDEWGTLHHVEAESTPETFHQQSSLLDAEVAALTLNILHRHTDRVKAANNSEMVNALQAIILTDHDNMLLTPVYHIFDMYRPFQGATPYLTSVAGFQYSFDGHKLAGIDVSAAKALDGKVYVALVNLDPHRAAEVTTNLTGKAQGMILTGPAIDTHNTFEAPETIHPTPFSGSDRNRKLAFQLPAKSIVVVAVQ